MLHNHGLTRHSIFYPVQALLCSSAESFHGQAWIQLQLRNNGLDWRCIFMLSNATFSIGNGLTVFQFVQHDLGCG